MVIGLIAVFCIIVLIDLPVLLKTNNKVKTMLVYFFLITLGFTISLLQISNNLPESPSKIIEKVIKSVL